MRDISSSRCIVLAADLFATPLPAFAGPTTWPENAVCIDESAEGLNPTALVASFSSWDTHYTWAKSLRVWWLPIHYPHRRWNVSTDEWECNTQTGVVGMVDIYFKSDVEVPSRGSLALLPSALAALMGLAVIRVRLGLARCPT